MIDHPKLDGVIWRLDGLGDQDSLEITAYTLRCPAAQLSSLQELLCESERQRAHRFKFEWDRRRYIVGRARLRQALAWRLELHPKAVEFRYGAHGKPCLAENLLSSTGPHFNLSNSGDIAVIAIHPQFEVGVDIEAIRSLSDQDELARRNFSDNEQHEYFGVEEKQRTQAFFNAWTRKEAFVKAIGLGLSAPLDRFDVSLRPGAVAEILRVGIKPGCLSSWRLIDFCPAPGYVAAAVVETPLAEGKRSAHE